MTSIYDELPAGQFVKWENVGDKVVGDVVSLGIGTSLNGDKVPELGVRLDDGSDVTVTASQANLKGEILRLRPMVGDRISIVYSATEKRDGGKTLKKFTVQVKQGGAKGTVAAEVEAEEPF